MAAATNIVVEWLKSLHLGQYSESFIDNGYDDLEICKQVGDPDLDAIGVFNPIHRSRLLQSVRTLREEGAASVYFTLEETDEQCLCDNVSARSSRGSSAPVSERSVQSVKERFDSPVPSSSGIGLAGGSSGELQQVAAARYVDEYEEGKAELVKIPRVQLKVLLKEKLQQDGIRLSFQPYSTTDGDRGYLEGLASRYADTFNTHYGDVLEHLEELRRREWDEMSPRMRIVNAGTPGTPPSGNIGHIGTSHGLTTSLSQPIYVPGKYSPSSCLSDKEEDEIYGFGYGVFGKQMLQRQQQQKMLTQQVAGSSSQQPLIMQQHHNYQSCLSPRSAYFYEFPPTDQNCQNTNKKKTTFSRFLRGLKTSHRKEKHSGSSSMSSPRHGRAARGIPQRVDTPDSVLQAGGCNFSAELGQHTILRSMVDPRDYDRLRYFQMNGGASNSFEETIHRLKVQEALKKKEKFHREHEEILRDIRQGLLQFGKEGVRGPLSSSDDTYMYDEDVRAMQPGSGVAGNDRGHWYDEPPYESDPEDFLMGVNSSGVPTATIQNGRVCFTLNLRPDQHGEGVISLRSAGDISLPREASSNGTPRRGLILPQTGPYPTTIIPLRTARDRESGDYAGSDVQSVSSRLSTISVETSRSEQQDVISPQFLPHPNNGKGRPFRKILGYTPRSEDGLSPSHSSDYEDQEEFDNISQQIATVHMSSDGRAAGVAGLVGRVRGLRQDVQRKITRLRNENNDIRQRSSDQAFPCSASSVESLPSGSGSSTQALVRAGSNHSSISAEDREQSPLPEQIVGRARALVDYTPSPYDKDALRFKKGDIIDVLSMNATGLWKGICNSRIGNFKFINVELLSSERNLRTRHDNIKLFKSSRGKLCSVEDLLIKIGLQEHISVFVLNGYEDLELFKEIEPADLDYLGILNPDHRAKILSAVQLLHDLDSGSEGDIAGSSSEGDDHMRARLNFSRNQFPRDSGCYDASLKNPATSEPFEEASTNNLDSVVQQCSNEILARVKQAQLQQEPYNIPPSPSTEKMPPPSRNPFHHDPFPRRASLNRCSIERRSAKAEEVCEADQKLTMVKYVVGGSSDLGVGESGNVRVNGGSVGGGCLSEKSSDSGVSSSSLSSTNPRSHPVGSSPTRSFLQNNNIYRNSDETTKIASDSK